MEPLHILYEDPHLVICCKPVGVLSEDGQAGRCMPELLREHYRSLGQKNPYIATVHRLDKITGGVMVFSRRREVTGKLTAAVQAHEIVKEYLAVLRGHPAEPAATLTDLLFRDAGHNKSYVVKRPRKGVREASLFYRELSRTEELSLVRVQLHTGRTHQIRAHLASIGCPILGDSKYGNNAANRELKLKYQALCAWELAFPKKISDPQFAALAGKVFRAPKPWYYQQILDGTLK